MAGRYLKAVHLDQIGNSGGHWGWDVLNEPRTAAECTYERDLFSVSPDLHSQWRQRYHPWEMASGDAGNTEKGRRCGRQKTFGNRKTTTDFQKNSFSRSEVWQLTERFAERVVRAADRNMEFFTAGRREAGENGLQHRRVCEHHYCKNKHAYNSLHNSVLIIGPGFHL